MSTRPVVIVLAAGRGSRFAGSDHKLAQRLSESTVLGTTLQHAIESQLAVVVVTTRALAGIACSSVAARDVVIIPEVETPGRDGQGMGRSIAVGVAARPEASGWLVLPGDMPLVRPATLKAVGDALAQHAVVMAQHKGRRGHPVGFSAELYSELVTLAGDEGARRLVARYPAHALETDDAGVLVDVDTLDDLDRVRLAADGVPLPGVAPLRS